MRRRRHASQSDEEPEKVESPLESDEASEGEAEARSDDEGVNDGEEGEELEEGQQQQQQHGEGKASNGGEKPGISKDTTKQITEVKKKEDPALVPTSGRYFLHDDRGSSPGGKRFVDKQRRDSDDKKEGNRRSKGNRRKDGPKENRAATLPTENKPSSTTKPNPPAEKKKEEKIVRYSNLRTQQNPESNADVPPRRQKRIPKDPQVRYQPKQTTKTYVPRTQPTTQSAETEPKPAAKPVSKSSPNGSNINNEQPPQNPPPPSPQPPALPFTVNAAPFTPMGLAFPVPQYPYQPYVLPPGNFQYQYPAPYPPFMGMPPGIPMVNQPHEMQYYVPNYAPVEGPVVSPRREEEQQKQGVAASPSRQKPFKRTENQSAKTQWVPVAKPRSHAIPIVSPEEDDGNRSKG